MLNQTTDTSEAKWYIAVGLLIVALMGLAVFLRKPLAPGECQPVCFDYGGGVLTCSMTCGK